jgi:mannose/fructose/N-acetylgalactosamine-specific phosphotransferase system component IIB
LYFFFLKKKCISLSYHQIAQETFGTAEELTVIPQDYRNLEKVKKKGVYLFIREYAKKKKKKIDLFFL